MHPEYLWGFFAGTLVYAFNKSDRPEACVVFWDLQTHETHAKYVKRLVAVKVVFYLDMLFMLAWCHGTCKRMGPMQNV